MIPISRVEMYLAKICGEDVELPIPQTRKEVFLAIIAGESYEKPVPSSRVELYLAKILGDGVPLPIPQSREEIFLAKIAGVEYPLPYPESRIEYWLHKWATYEEWSTITGNPVSFTAKAAPLRKLEVAFSPVQEGSGDPSPDNVRPISGWSSLTVEQRGKNLLDPDTFDSYTAYTVNADGSITISAGNSSAWGSDVNKPVFLKAGTYTLSRTETSGRCAVRSSSNSYGADIAVIQPNAYNITFTLTEDAFIKIKINTGASEYPVTSFFMLELGSTATEYVPYTPSSRSISISLGSTVYSGTVDVVTGVGEVTWAKIVLDGTQDGLVADWRSSATSAGFYYNFTGLDVLAPAGLDVKTTSISDKLKSASYQDCYYGRAGYDASFSWFNTSGWNRLVGRIPDPTLTTKELLTAYFTNNPITIVYELATPIPIQLTPQEVQSLVGDNVLFSDANGDLTVTYRSN